MLRDKIAQIIYEGYTGLQWPDEDEHLNNAARKHADEILELPEIKQMREALEWACNIIKAETECNLSKYGCKDCPIFKAKEGK